MTWDVGAYEYGGTTPPMQSLPAPLNLKAICATDAKTADIQWDAVPRAESYYFRATLDGIAVAYVDGLNATTYALPITPGANYHVWVHGYNPAYPPDDPAFPSGVGKSSALDFACQPVTVPPDPIPPDPVPIPPDPLPAPGPSTVELLVNGSLKASGPIDQPLNYKLPPNKKTATITVRTK